MKIREYKVKTRGGNQYSKNRDKVYEYKLKWVFGIKIEDIVELLGVDAACILLQNYGGACMYIPKPITIKRRIQAAMIREDYQMLVEKGLSHGKTIEQLIKKYKINISTIELKIGKRFSNIATNKETQLLKEECDKKLVKLVGENYEKFKKYNII